MVTNRFVTITHKTSTKRFRVKRGCPQGGILSPFLWNLVVDDLHRYSAKEIPGYIQAFADDLIVLCESNDLEVARARTIKSINTIERWCKTKGLNISALKTKIVNFTWKTKWSLNPIKVGGKPITLSKTVKFLGVTLDSKLKFNEHVEKITSRATATLMQCKKAVGPTWGMTPKTCKWIYLAVVRPILMYCSTIWVKALQTENNRRKLRRVQSLALRIMSGAMPGTPHEMLDHITNTPDIINFLNGEAAKGATRLQAYEEWTKENPKPKGKGNIFSHTALNNEFVANMGLPKASMDLIKPKLAFNNKFTTEIPTHGEIVSYKAALPDRIDNIDPTTITCYTDGSKTEDSKTGYGFIITTNNNKQEITRVANRLPDFCTVFQAEATGLTQAAKALQSTVGKDIIFLTDSLPTIKALRNKLIKSLTVKR